MRPMEQTDAVEYVDLASAAVVMLSRQGRIEYWSDGATRLFGYPGEAMRGSRVDPLIPVEYRQRHWRAWGHAWKTNSIPDPSAVMIPVVCADGTVQTFVAQLVPIRAPHGDLLAVAAVWCAPSAADANVRSLV
jgi:PAS domain S-box-containing protein